MRPPPSQGWLTHPFSILENQGAAVYKPQILSGASGPRLPQHLEARPSIRGQENAFQHLDKALQGFTPEALLFTPPFLSRHWGRRRSGVQPRVSKQIAACGEGRGHWVGQARLGNLASSRILDPDPLPTQPPAHSRGRCCCRAEWSGPFPPRGALMEAGSPSPQPSLPRRRRAGRPLPNQGGFGAR